MISQKTQTDILLDIATGRNRKEMHWKNKRMLWTDLIKKLAVTHRTAETIADYLDQPKGRQDEIKDVGGFVGGLLSSGRRKPESVLHRGLITLDLDSAPQDFWDLFTTLYDYTACIYSTHKHTPEKPRLRLILPLNRVVNVTEYEAIARRLAGELGIEAFDDTGFQHYRLMYWPSTSRDGDFVFQYQDGPLLNADRVLSTYHDYTDASQWPVSDRVGARVKREITKQGDPLTKRGLIGAFCRLYSISDVIDRFLGDEYEATAHEDRYSFKRGSTAGGLVVYDDKYAYSHHGTDPVSGKLCNAFDLVRLHKFGLQDEDTSEKTTITKKPSYKAMIDFVRGLGEVKEQVVSEKLEAAQIAFAGVEMTEKEIVIDQENRSALGLPSVPDVVEVDGSENGKEWIKGLELDKTGEAVKCTFGNIVTILRNDPLLRGRIAFNDLKNFPVVLGGLPWQVIDEDNPIGRGFDDRDAADLRGYLETIYSISGPMKVKDAIISISYENRFHPIRNYIGGLQWDGVERLDRVLCEYFGAEDSPYTRAITRKWFVAAVARVMRPGVKFDYALTFIGEEGIYKSTFIDIMFDPWFTDNFSFHMLNSKQAAEQLSGYWGVEIGELSGLKRMELESVKTFLARRKDVQRGAFKEYIKEALRQCVFAATTNEERALKGSTGNRRFWVLLTGVGAPSKDITELPAERGQLWAEAVDRFKKGEKLFLRKDLEKEARRIQSEHTETDDRQEVIEKYLEMKLPANWAEMTVWQRKGFLLGDALSPLGTQTRERVSVAEIWVEALGCHIRDMNSVNTKPIHDIMRKIPGWKQYKSKTNFKNYGTQRGYYRE